MKLLGSLTDYIKSVFKKDGQDVTLRPNQSTTYTAARDVQLPPGDADHVVVSADSTQTLTNKTFDADGTGNSLTNVEDANIKSGAAIDATKIADGSVTSTEFQYINTVSSNVQDQIDSKADDSDLTTHIADTTTHGTAGNIVGDSDTQTLTNKTLTSPKVNEAVDLTATSTELNQLDGVSVGGTGAGDIATIDGTQTLTNKTFDADGTGNSLTNIEDANVKVGANIDAAKIGTGIISTTELNYLNGIGSQVAGTVDTQLISNKTLSAFKYNTTTVTIASNTFAKSVESIMYVTAGSGPLNTITGGADGDVKILVNELGSDLTIANDSGADGIITGSGADLSLNDDSSLTIIYRAAESRWKVVGGAGSGGGLELANVSTTLNPAAKNTHYLTDSSGGAFTITLPAGEVGAVIRFSDVAASWDTNSVTLDADGAETIDGDLTLELDVESTWAQLMWDGSEWKVDHAFVPQAADFTGDLTVDGIFEVEDGNSKARIIQATAGGDDVSARAMAVELSRPSDGNYSGNSIVSYTKVTGGNEGMMIGGRNFLEFHQDGVPFGIISGSKFGVGTLSPDSILHVEADTGDVISKVKKTTGSVELNTAVDASSGYIRTQSSHSLHLGTANTHRLTIDTDGEVGIGTTAPAMNLHIDHNSGSGGIRIQDNNDRYVDLRKASTSNNFEIYNSQNSSVAMAIKETNAYIGFGTSNPANRFQVETNENAISTAEFKNLDGTNSSSRFRVRAVADDTVAEMAAIHDSGAFFGSNSNHDTKIIRNGGTKINITDQIIDKTFGSHTIRYEDDGGNNRCYHTGTSGTLNWGITGNRWKNVYGVDITGTNAYTTPSDVNMKKDIANTVLGLDFIDSLRPVSYKLIDNQSERTHYGLIAQEVEQAVNDAGIATHDMAAVIKYQHSEMIESIDEDGNSTHTEGPEEERYALRYTELMSPMIKAIQELKAENEALRARVDTLEGA